MKNQWRCCWLNRRGNEKPMKILLIKSKRTWKTNEDVAVSLCVTQPSKTHRTSPCATSKDREMKISWDPQRPAIGPLEDTIAMLAASRVLWKRISWLQHIAAYCSILQHIAAYCSILQHIAAYCSILQHIAAYCSILQHIAAYCSILQHIAAYCSILQHTLTWNDMDIVHIPWTRYVDIFVAVFTISSQHGLIRIKLYRTWCRRFFGFMAALMSLMYSPAYSRPSGLPTTKFCLQEISISLQILFESVQSCSPCAKGIDRKWYSIHSRSLKTFIHCRDSSNKEDFPSSKFELGSLPSEFAPTMHSVAFPLPLARQAFSRFWLSFRLPILWTQILRDLRDQIFNMIQQIWRNFNYARVCPYYRNTYRNTMPLHQRSWNRPASSTPRSDVHLPRCRSQCRGCRCSWTAENIDWRSKCLDKMD